MLLAYLAWTYLIAAVPFGVVVSTLYGGDVDVRQSGSGNIGATNVARLYGWRVALPVLVLDILKGFLPTLLAPTVFPEAGLWWPFLVGGVAFWGHCRPVFLAFRGGKGVATGAGVMLALAPVPTLVAIGFWVLVLGTTGRSSVAGLGASTAAVLLAAWLQPAVLPFAGLLGLSIAFTHVANIRRLVQGEEEEVVRPVRWGRRQGAGPSVEEILQQAPGGGSAEGEAWPSGPVPAVEDDPTGL